MRDFIAGASQALGQHPLVGKWVLHIYVGGRLFDDKVTITQGPNGLGGRLIVPDRFEADLRTVRLDGDKVYIDIKAVERGQPIEVKYEGVLHPTGNTFVGYAHEMGSNELVGGFVADRVPITRL